MIHFFSVPNDEQFVFSKGNLITETAKSLEFNFEQQYNHEDSCELQAHEEIKKAEKPKQEEEKKQSSDQIDSTTAV